MSGGHWDYLQFRLEDIAERGGKVWELLGGIEHELDWGLSGDSCYECAKIRVIAALENFFDHDAIGIEDALHILRSTRPECVQCQDREKLSKPKDDWVKFRAKMNGRESENGKP